MAKKKPKWTIESAEKIIKDYGGQVIDEKVYVPPDSSGTAMDKEWDEYWSAHEYECDLDDPIAYIEPDEL